MANAQMMFFLLAFFLLYITCTEAREIPATSTTERRKEYREENGIAKITSLRRLDDAATADCKDLNSEECLMKRSMVAHTDYIYTQDIRATAP
ncbi:unnamed protein product [Malus baccata var. baccata]